MKNLRFYISPYFIAKYYILKDIKSIVKNYDFKGSLLDIGCGEKPYKSLFPRIQSYVGIDFEKYSINKDFKGEVPEDYFSKDYLEDLALPYKDAQFNNVAAFQVLEHHKNPQKMLSEVSRVINSGGLVLMTAPFLGGIHEEPCDYQRLTRYGLIELLKKNNFEILDIKEQGSVFSTISMLLNEYLNDLASRNRVYYVLSIIFYLPFLIFQYLTLFLDKIFSSKKIFFNYLILARKK